MDRRFHKRFSKVHSYKTHPHTQTDKQHEVPQTGGCFYFIFLIHISPLCLIPPFIAPARLVPERGVRVWGEVDLFGILFADLPHFHRPTPPPAEQPGQHVLHEQRHPVPLQHHPAPRVLPSRATCEPRGSRKNHE